LNVIFFLLAFTPEGNEPGLVEQKQALEKQIATASEPARLHMKLSQVLQELGEHKASVAHAEKALESLDDSAEAHYRYAVALRHKMEKSPLSWVSGKAKYLQNLERAIELDKTFVPAYQELAGFNLSAPGFLGAHADKALKIGEALAVHDVKQGGLLIVDAYEKKQDGAKALQALKTLSAQLPNDQEIHYKVGFYLQTREQYRESLTFFEKEVEGEALDPTKLYQAARSRILGNFELENAIALLDRYAEVRGETPGPTLADALWRQGVAHLGLNNKAEAKRCFQKALDLDPEHANAKEGLQDLRSAQ